MPQQPAHPFASSARPYKPTSAVLAEAEQQWIFTEEELLRSPSIADGMAAEEERERRAKGVNFITQVGIMLKLPQTTLTTAVTFFQRFLMRQSLVSSKTRKAKHHFEVAATSLFLATKVEETCRRIKELVVACCRVAQKNASLTVDENTKDFWKWKDTITYSEDVLLETLCFDLTVESPYNILYDFLKLYNVDRNKQLRNTAWSVINDSNQTQLCLLFTSRTIAAMALYVAAKKCDTNFPDDARGRPWWEVQGVKIEDLRKASNYMLDLYEKAGNASAPGSSQPYVRTPESGSQEFAKTRLRRDNQAPKSPSQNGAAIERSQSSQSLKRGRDADEGVEDGEVQESDEQKKAALIEEEREKAAEEKQLTPQTWEKIQEQRGPLVPQFRDPMEKEEFRRRVNDSNLDNQFLKEQEETTQLEY